MANEKDTLKKCGSSTNTVSSAVYGMGFLGAVVYFIQHAGSFGEGIIGVLKAIIWPALLVYKALELLQF